MCNVHVHGFSIQPLFIIQNHWDFRLLKCEIWRFLAKAKTRIHQWLKILSIIIHQPLLPTINLQAHNWDCSSWFFSTCCYTFWYSCKLLVPQWLGIATITLQEENCDWNLYCIQTGLLVPCLKLLQLAVMCFVFCGLINTVISQVRHCVKPLESRYCEGLIAVWSKPASRVLTLHVKQSCPREI